MSELVVGFLGLGQQGRPIAERLASSYQVLAYDPVLEPGSDGHPFEVLADLQSVIRSTDVVFFCLPNPTVSLEVSREVAAVTDRRATLIVELSTIGPKTSRECCEIIRGSGLAYVDCPVSGGVVPAQNGTMTTMLAGADADLAVVKPLLSTFSNNIFEMGSEPSLGQVMKVTNNVITATSMAVTSEAVLCGVSLGLDMSTMVDVLNVSTGRTSASEDKFPQAVIPRNFNYGATGATVNKDVGLFLEAAGLAGSPIGLSQATKDFWNRYVQAHPTRDFTQVYEYLEDVREGRATETD